MILGQTVLVNQTTTIEPTVSGMNLLSLVPGRDVLEASGFVTGDGVIVGALIDLKTGTPDYKVKGFIKNHDTAGKTFEIGSLTVDYRNVDLKEMPSQSSNAWNGLLVDVWGSQVSSGGSGSYSIRMNATRVKPEGLTAKTPSLKDS